MAHRPLPPRAANPNPSIDDRSYADYLTPAVDVKGRRHLHLPTLPASKSSEALPGFALLPAALEHVWNGADNQFLSLDLAFYDQTHTKQAGALPSGRQVLELPEIVRACAVRSRTLPAIYAAKVGHGDLDAVATVRPHLDRGARGANR
jgi:hypothetical protein